MSRQLSTQASLKRLKKQIYDDTSFDSSEGSALKGYTSLPKKKTPTKIKSSVPKKRKPWHKTKPFIPIIPKTIVTPKGSSNEYISQLTLPSHIID